MITRMGQIAQRINAFIKRAVATSCSSGFHRWLWLRSTSGFWLFSCVPAYAPAVLPFPATSTAADNHNFFQWRSQRDPLNLLTNC